MAQGIDEQVEQFIFNHIDSIEQLEILLFLRSHAEKAFTIEAITNELRTNATSVETRIAPLVGIGAITLADNDSSKSGLHYQYRPSHPALRATIDALAEAHKTYRHRIFSLIFSPMKRARSFADAFLVPGKKPEGGEDG